MSKYRAIIDLGRDLARGQVAEFSNEVSNDKLRTAILKAIECEDGKYDYVKFRRNKLAVFEILEEVLDERLAEDIRDQFEQFVEYRDLNFGDTLKFVKYTDDLFEVSMISGGNNNLRRQRLEGQSDFTISTDWYGIKIYEEFERFLTGRVDWTGMISNIERSFTRYLIKQIYDAVRDAYSGLDAPYYVSGNFDKDKFLELVMHVEVESGQDVIVMGTKKALAKVEPAYVTSGGLDLTQRNNDGFFRVVDGVTLLELKQGHIPGTDTFAIDEDFLLVVPNGTEKIVKLVTEGRTLIREATGQDNADDSQEYTVRKKFGLGVVANSKYGVYVLA